MSGLVKNPLVVPGGPWLQTYKGGAFTPTAPRVEDLDLDDIAHTLSNLCRFTGHTQSFYSVAQHCCRVATELLHMQVDDPDVLLAGLLHDAAEAYVHDLPGPLKQLPALRAVYKPIELAVEDCIRRWAGLSEEAWSDPRIKVADVTLLRTEAGELMSPLHESWSPEHHPDRGRAWHTPPWPPLVARRHFTEDFFVYSSGRLVREH